ncbi:MAG: hypothetical protein NC086_01940 [Alistipes sp.]|nr:hypothetical protein [Alistipes sp.]
MMFDEDMREDNGWNPSALEEKFWRERIRNNVFNPFVMSERDNAYLREMYPKEARIIGDMIENELNMVDYRGSFIYDEYPDKYLFFRIVNKVVDNYFEQAGADDLANIALQDKQWIQEIAQVILANEIYRRRNRRKYW